MRDLLSAFAVKLNWRLTNMWFIGFFLTLGPIIFANAEEQGATG